MVNYYPLAAQNEWRYRINDGSTYVNKVTAVNGNEYVLHNSAANISSRLLTDGNRILTDVLEAGNFQQWLANDLQPGASWEVRFRANGLEYLLVMAVKETGISKEVDGRIYQEVLFIEAENMIIVNGNPMPLKFFTQYYYASGLGLILTTSSAGDMHSLVEYRLY